MFRYMFVILLAVLALPPRSAGQQDVPATSDTRPAGTRPAQMLTLVQGVVRDAAGQPIAGAKAYINDCQGFMDEAISHAILAATDTTDERGAFALRADVAADKLGNVTLGVWVRKAGYQLGRRERIPVRVPPPGPPRDVETVHGVRHERAAMPGPPTQVEIRLAKGEVLAGRVDLPLEAHEKQLGRRLEDKVYIVEVENESFQDSFLTEKGGAFEIYVPRGTYILRVRYRGFETLAREAVTGTRDIVITPPPVVINKQTLSAAFDALWDDMDRKYSYFALKKVDWKSLGVKYRPRAIRAGSQDEFVEVLREMLAELKDMHVWISIDGQQRVSPWGVGYRKYWNARAVAETLLTRTECGRYAILGVTKPDGFGCVIIMDQGAANEQTVEQTRAAIDKLKDVPGFLVDLRPGTFGGSEPLAMPIAEAFCPQTTAYARSKCRDGPGHNDFTEDSERTIEGSPGAFTRPVVCLIGDRCMSSGEAMVQMFACLPHVTTLGDRTRGSSGNPVAFPVPGLPIEVWYSRWVDMMPDGRPIEGAGIVPQVQMDLPPAAFRDRDPVWERGLELLRQKTGAASRPTQPAGGGDH